jgi:hypothetical protein
VKNNKEGENNIVVRIYSNGTKEKIPRNITKGNIGG